MNQEKALVVVRALSVIVKTEVSFAALVCTLSTAEEEAAAERDHHHHIIIVSCGHQQHFCQDKETFQPISLMHLYYSMDDYREVKDSEFYKISSS